MHTLHVLPISTHAFARYGWLIDATHGAGTPINAASAERLDGQSGLDLNADGGRPCLALFKAHPRNPAGPWIEIERHRLGTQTFIPLAGARYVVLVALGALDDTRPDESTLAAFAVDGHQAVTLRAGVWHHSLLALQASSFVVIERSAPSVDCDIANLSEPVSTTVPPESMQLAPQSVAPA